MVPGEHWCTHRRAGPTRGLKTLRVPCPRRELAVSVVADPGMAWAVDAAAGLPNMPERGDPGSGQQRQEREDLAHVRRVADRRCHAIHIGNRCSPLVAVKPGPQPPGHR